MTREGIGTASPSIVIRNCVFMTRPDLSEIEARHEKLMSKITHFDSEDELSEDGKLLLVTIPELINYINELEYQISKLSSQST